MYISGTGEVVARPPPETPLDVSVPATAEERLAIDVRLEAAAVKEMNIPWRSQSGIVESITAVVEE